MPKKNCLTPIQINALKQFIEKKNGTARELSRAQAIFMHEEKMSRDLIKMLTGVKKSALFKWRSRFIKNGLEGLREREKRKAKALLTKKQIEEVVEILRMQKPSDFGYESFFWTSLILAHLLKERYNVQYKTRKPLYLLFKQAKHSFHLPGKQYHKRNQDGIDQWKIENKALIKTYLQDQDAVVLVGDEMILSTQTTSQKIWLPRNEFPKIDVSNNRSNRSIYGFLNIRDDIAHAYKAERQNAEITCKILEKLCRIYKDKKIVLIWDNAPWHRAEKIREWLRQTKYNIFLIAFPPYAPELNPQEHVWKAGRAAVSHNVFIKNIDKTTDAFVSYLNNNLFKYSFLGLVHA